MNITTIILAAGKGTRMNVSDLPKVLVPLDKKPMLEYVLETVEKLKSDNTVLIVGYMKEKIEEYINSKNFSNISVAVQEEQLGTGHAVQQAENILKDSNSQVLILCGDVPMLTETTLNKFVKTHISTNSTLSVLSAMTDNPKGYGRIIRDSEDEFKKIVEEKDCNESERLVNEINSGTYIVDSKELFSALEEIDSNNAQGEFYLTDIVEIIQKRNKKVIAYPTNNIDEIQGINSLETLKELENKINKKPFNILGVQQIAIGGENKEKHSKLWSELFGIKKIGEYKSESENVNEDIYELGLGLGKVEIDIMEPLDIDKKPAVHNPKLNHFGLWVDDLDSAYKYLSDNGVRFTPGGIRKGASGHDVCFIHPKGNEEFPVSAEGVLIELVQAPQAIISQFKDIKE